MKSYSGLTFLTWEKYHKSPLKSSTLLHNVIWRWKDLEKFKVVLKLLQQGQELPAKYKDHALSGDYIGCRECHIEPDWLLV